MSEERRKGGRPPGVKRPHKVYTYVNDEELKALEELAEELGGTIAAALRSLIAAHRRTREKKQ